MEEYDFARAAQSLRQFTWNEFADWYVEWSKGRLYEDFEVGEVRTHHWGRTIALSDTLLFTTLNGQDYLRQLRALGVILAVPQPDGQYLVFRSLTEYSAQVLHRHTILGTTRTRQAGLNRAQIQFE